MIGEDAISSAPMVKQSVIGLSHKKLSSPSEIINARRRFSSIKPPKMNPNSRGLMENEPSVKPKR